MSLRALTIGLCMTVVAIAFEAIAVATAMPVAAPELNGLSYYAWSFSLFLIGMLFATVVTGRLSDRIGPARPLLIGLGVFAVGLLVAGTASSMATLVAGRLIQGLGSGAMNTAAFVIIAQEFDARRRPRMFTYISTAWVLPAFVGPPIAAWLTRQLSWHWVFLAVLPLVVLGGGIVLPTLLRLIQIAGRPAPTRRPGPLRCGRPASSPSAAAALQLAGQRLDLWSVPLVVLAVVALGPWPTPADAGRLLPDRPGAAVGDLGAGVAARGLLRGRVLPPADAGRAAPPRRCSWPV